MVSTSIVRGQGILKLPYSNPSQPRETVVNKSDIHVIANYFLKHSWVQLSRMYMQQTQIILVLFPYKASHLQPMQTLQE